jgi:hypothetical protein
LKATRQAAPPEGNLTPRVAVSPCGVIGFGLAAVFAVTQKWSLPEFCWSTWLAGLVYTWACVAAAAVQIILNARSDKPAYEERLPFLRSLPPVAFLLGVTAVSLAAGLIAFRVYSFLFGFYGLFLSVFAEMEPHSLFGRNGFINSDFFTPVKVLAALFWPMAAGSLIANWRDLISRKNPWKRVFLPLQKEVIRIHVLTLALPFFSLLAWALFRESYQSITIVLLMGVFFLLPKEMKKSKPEMKEDSD